MPPEILTKIVSLAKFGARMRGSVSRDFYRNDIVMSRPMAEVGTRLGQQLAKLARGMAMVYGRPEVTEFEYHMIKKVMLDTISQRNEDVLRTMINAMGGPEKMAPISMREMAAKTHYPFATIQRLMQDLIALQIIKKVGSGSVSAWTLSDYVAKEVKDSQLYNQSDMEHKPIGRIRLRRRKKEKNRLGKKIRIAIPTIKVSSTGSKITIAPAQSGPVLVQPLPATGTKS
jgi:hypothetical protein